MTHMTTYLLGIHINSSFEIRQCSTGNDVVIGVVLYQMQWWDWSPLESDSTDSGLETANISFFGPSDDKRIRIKLIPTDVFLRPSTDLISSEGFL